MSGLPIAVYYFALLAATGAFYPYFALYLTSVGLSPSTATHVVAILPFMSLFAPPLLGLLADARAARVWILRVLSLATALVFACFQLAAGNVVAVVAVATLLGLVRSPLSSLADATAFEHVRLHGGSYGQLRVWGTVGYLVAAFGGGALIEATSLGSVVWTTTAMLTLAAACAWGMPAPPLARRTRALHAYGQMLRRPTFWLFLGCVVPAQIAGSIYDSAFSLHMTRLGHGGTFIGLALAIGVAAEVILMMRSGGILVRHGAERTLVLALTIGAARWFAMAHIDSAALLLLLQPLHAISFGLYWVSITALVRDYAGPDALAAGQGLLASVLAGGSVLGIGFAGDVLERFGSQTLWLCAAALAGVAAVGAAFHAHAHERARESGRARSP